MNNNDLRRFYHFNEDVINKKDFVRIGQDGKIDSNILPYKPGDIDDHLSLDSTNPVQNKVITAALNEKQDELTFDNSPQQGSDNPVKSSGIYLFVASLTPQDIGALPNTTKYGSGLSYENNSLQLLDQNGDGLGDPVTITGGGGGPAEITVETTGDGNAITSVSYDSETGEMTFNKGDTFLTSANVDSALNTSSENPVQNKVIAELIPSQASSSNQLADIQFVNSSIATNTANFIGTFETISALNSYSGTVTNNDYAFVVNSVVKDNGNDWASFNALNLYDKTLLTNFDYAWVINGSKFDLYRFDIVNQVWDQRATNINKTDVSLNSAYNRYKATVSGSTVTWSFEYTLNNSSFTANQWAAINSGMTAADKTKLDGIESGAEVNTINSISVDNNTLTPDANKNVNIDLSGKLDKDTSTAGDARLYGINANGTQTTFILDYSNTASAGRVPRRSSSGALMINDNTYDNPGQFNDGLQAINKNILINRTTAKIGALDPTNAIEGYIGQFYINTVNNTVFQCIAKTAQGTTPETYTYTWVKLIKETDVASNSSLGLVKVNKQKGISLDSNNVLQTEIANTLEIGNRSGYVVITPSNINTAVKATLTDTNHFTMTSSEQDTAQEVLGIQYGLLRLDE